MMHIFDTIALLRGASDPTRVAPFLEVLIPYEKSSLAAEWFRPSGPGKHPAILLSHGFTKGGSHEPRIRQLASGLRAVGFHVLVPSFPEAEDHKVSPKTLSQIVASFSYLATLSDVDTNQMGIFGISYGATLGLIAAGMNEISKYVAFVVSLGGYASLKNVVAYGLTGKYPKDGSTFPISPDSFVKEIFENNPDAHLYEKELSIQPELSISRTTKIVLIHSKTDAVIPWREMEVLQMLLKSKQVPVKSYLIQLDGHARITKWFAGLQTFLAARAIVKLKIVTKIIAGKL